MSNTSRATSQARVRLGTEAPVSSISRNKNVMPDVSIISLTTEVVMISRRSGCDSIRSANRARSWAGKYASSTRRRYGSSGRREASTSSSAEILVCASSRANSGVVRPPPADRRSAISRSPGSTSCSGSSRLSRTSLRRYRACTCSREGACDRDAARAMFCR